MNERGFFENQALVDSYVEQLCTKIAAAQFNVNYVLPNNYSMTTAIAKAQTYEKDADKYGNYNVLQNAVADANTFRSELGTFNGRIENQVANTISSYADLVTKIVAAFTGLQPAFKLISNGTFANQGKTVKSEYASAKRPNNFKFYWEYSTDQIIFITNHEAYSYELPISRWGSYNGQTVMILILYLTQSFLTQTTFQTVSLIFRVVLLQDMVGFQAPV